ncbi:MAG: DUF2202 domain-containing protein [Planctomycetales bacterium]|nr:DUF2202 domain-containing protein [Planctomycetales bacterium]
MQDPVQIQALTDAEIDALVFVREEEKLARDVYATLGAAWGDAVFSNIAVAEQNHMDAVKTLLDKHEIVDPVTDDSVGVFTNPVLQQLYDDLTSDAVVDLSYAGVDVQMQGGASSYLAALQVGAFIEEFDILDLMRNQDDIAAPDVANVFANLLAGSENHLRAFNARLEAVGNPYEPVLMTGMDAELGDLDALYASIIGAEQATGQQNAGTQRQARDGAFAQLATT